MPSLISVTSQSTIVNYTITFVSFFVLVGCSSPLSTGEVPEISSEHAVSQATLTVTGTEQPSLQVGEEQLGTSCASPSVTISISTPPVSPSPSVSPSWVEEYQFPTKIDPSSRYLFYLHGKIIENEGIQAVSPVYGAYEYQGILETFSAHGFRVISEPRPKDAESSFFAWRIKGQVEALLKAGVPPSKVTVVGASKGAAIAILVSNLVENLNIRYVLLSICNPDLVTEFVLNQTILHGHVLSIYDQGDDLAGTCQELFEISEGKGILDHQEIELNIGLSHGMLYQPLDDWVMPTVEWALKDFQ